MRRTRPDDKSTALTIRLPMTPTCPVCGVQIHANHGYFGTPIVTCGRAECVHSPLADAVWRAIPTIGFDIITFEAKGLVFYVPYTGVVDSLRTLRDRCEDVILAQLPFAGIDVTA